ncbi:MAG: two-component regulator propeller domain-containing protein [Ginsengibacter sp.]
MHYKSKTCNSTSVFKQIICAGIFLFSLCIASFAQQQAYFNNLTEKDGLSNNRVTCFYKDKTGYMWIGTESGLNLYNGNSWKIYKPSLHQKNYLSSSFITDIEEDAKGSIWVCTRKGLNRIDMAADTTEVFLPDDSTNSTAIPNDIIWDAYPDNDSSIWIAADGRELCRYNPVKKIFYYYNFKECLRKNHIETHSGYHSILRILPKSAKELWLGTTDGIFSFNKQTGGFALQAAMALSEITFFNFDKRFQKLYCADEENKLYCFDPLKKEMTAVSLQRNKHTGKFIPPYSQEENILFVPAAEGLAAINEKNEVLYFLAGASGKENDLLPGKVNCIYKDRQHITWVGTMNGVSKFIPVLNNNLHLAFPNKLSYDPYLTFKNFMYYQRGDEWLITSWRDNKIFVANNKTGIITNLQKPAAYSHDTCYAFYSHNADSIFIFSSGSLLMYNSRFKKWNKIIFPFPYGKTIITCMAIDAAGNYWMGNIRKQLFVYNPRSRHIWRPSKDDIGEDATYCVAADVQNNCMWIGTTGYGLIRYNFYRKKFEVIELNNKAKTALHSSIINEIIPDGKGDIWVATFEGGLAKYKTSLPPDKGFINYDIFSGLPDDNVYSVAVEEQGGAWFTTIKGIGHIGADGTWKGLYNQQSGLPYSEFRQSIAVLPDGKIATVNENNFICFNPSAITASYNYPVIIDDIFVNDTIIVTNKKPGDQQKFNYEQNVFAFNFSVLDFISPGAVEYYYMLEGLEKDWVFAGKQHSIRYSKLPPGEYTFKVKAKKENGGFYPREGSFYFYIMPPFWETWWFILLIAFGVLLLLFGFMKWRIKNIKAVEAQKLKVQQLNAEQYKNNLEHEKIINYFSSSLINKATIEDVLWDVAKNLIGRLGFVDCMIYLWNDDNTKMIQKAGIGPKGSVEEINKQHFDVLPGQGVVGYVMETKEAVLINDTSKDTRYRSDEMIRSSEITVPVIYNNELVGVIDSEHHEKNFFTAQHLQILNTIATLMATKIRSIEAEQSLQRTRIEMYSMNEQLSKARLEALRSQMNPHFIFNCINSIDALIQSNDKYNATVYLNKFAKLIRGILDSSKQNTVSLSTDLDTLKLYIELEQFRHEDKFVAEIQADEELLQDDYKVPPLIIQPFVENAILHGLRYRHDNKGKLSISVNRQNGHLKYVVEDNGVGRNANRNQLQKNKISYGIDMSTERVKLFNNEEQSSVYITDLFAYGKPAGTKVSVLLKIEKC